MQRTMTISERAAILFAAIILCAAALAGCRRETGAVTDAAATMSPAPASPTPTQAPTPTPLPFVMQAYETCGRDDVYRVPVEGFSDNRTVMAADVAGDYVLLWTTRMYDDPAEDETEPDVCILAKPGISTEQYGTSVDFIIGQRELRKDGTVILTDWETGRIHVYDNTMTETGVFVPGEEGAPVLEDNWDLGYEISNSDYTWLIRTPEYEEGLLFPKSKVCEYAEYYIDNKLCGSWYRWNGETLNERGIRIYDLKNGIATGPLLLSDLPGCKEITARGELKSGFILLTAAFENGENGFLLWDKDKTTAPMEGLFDLKTGDFSEYITGWAAKLEEDYGIAITPDRAEEGVSPTEDEMLSKADLINCFLLEAKSGSEILKTKSGNMLRPENMRSNDGAVYTFNPHVFSEFYLKEHGEERRDIFFGYVDALRAGEDRFRCPDDNTASWCANVLAGQFFPVSQLYVKAYYDKDGWAQIDYRIPKEEFLEKEREFEEMICSILNDVLEKDYTDLEKALAMYEFLTEYCTYDYVMLEHNKEWEWWDKQSGYRCLTEKTGICGEIAALYSYLLLQCGVEIEESSGEPYDENEEFTHAWTYVTLDGQGYLIDPTWGLTNYRTPDLTYFLFTDEMRSERDGFDPASYTIGGGIMYECRAKYSFEADDARYSELWGGSYIAFDHDEKCIFFREWNGTMHRFDYGESEEKAEEGL